jgi:amidase
MKISRFPNNLHTTNVTIHLQHLDESLSKCGPKNVDIRELSIELAQRHFRTGFLTSFDLTMCYLVRIEKMDKKYLKSVIEVNPDALDIAKKADKDRVMGKPLSLNPLHGIPILIKDNIGTADNMQTTCGSIAMEYIKSREDSEVVKLLRAAGAIILGKSNPVEWAK